MNNKIYQQIAKLGKAYGADKIVLFGSRARNDHRERSDIDIAVYGLADSARAAFRSAVEELPTLLNFDIVFIDDNTDSALLLNIQKDGITLMSKMDEKYNKFIAATDKLCAAIDDYDKYGLDTIRDGVIQKFEFCTELAWKTLREYLTEQGYTDLNSPKNVMKTAFADGILNDEQGWLEILDARNITSHVYDEATAEKIFNNIRGTYADLFKQLTARIKVK